MFTLTAFSIFFYFILAWFVICAFYIARPAIKELYRIIRYRNSEFEELSDD